MTQSSPNRSRLAPVVEVLESRIAPATLTAPGTFDYLDGDGDIVKVKVEGLFSSVDMLNALGNDVTVSGGDIAKIIVTKPGPNFAITLADSNATGNNLVELGVISGPNGARLPLINGIYTVPSADGFLRYELEGYRGAGFSKGGGLKIFGTLTGSAATGGGLDLTNVPIDTGVFFSRGIAAGATALVSVGVTGEVKIGGTLDGTLTAGTVLGSLFLETVNGQVVVQKNLVGRISAADVPGLIEVQGSTSVISRISTTGDMNLNVGKDLIGSLQVVGDLALTVGRNISAAEVLVGANLSLGVGGSIVKSRVVTQEQFLFSTGVRNDVIGSSLVGGTGLKLSVGRALLTSRLSSGVDNMELSVGTNVTGTQLVGGDDMSLTVGGSVATSRILPDGQLDALITGNVTGTQIGSQSSSAFITVGGKMLASTLIAGEDATVGVGGDVATLNATVGATATLTTPKNLATSKFSVGSDLHVTVGGNLLGSTLLPANTLDVVVTKNLTGSTLASFDNSTSLNVGGTIAATSVESGDGVNVVAGTVTSSAQFRAAANVDVVAAKRMDGFVIASGDVTVQTPGIFGGTVSAGQDLSLTADSVKILGAAPVAPTDPGAMPGAGTPSGLGIGGFRGLRVGGDLQLDVVKDYLSPQALIGGDVTKFRVGGNFKGTFRVAGDLLTGDSTGSTTVIGGIMDAASLIQIAGNVGSIDSSPQLIFGGPFLGRLQVGGVLQTDLTFNAGASRLTFDGGVGSALLGDKIVNIVVNGTLASLSSSTLFQRTDSKSGKFVDGLGTISGLLDATVAAIKVIPVDFLP